LRQNFHKKIPRNADFFSKLAAKKCLESLAHILYLKFVEVDAGMVKVLLQQ
jgi:hypothetical protein